MKTRGPLASLTLAFATLLLASGCTSSNSDANESPDNGTDTSNLALSEPTTIEFTTVQGEDVSFEYAVEEIVKGDPSDFESLQGYERDAEKYAGQEPWYIVSTVVAGPEGKGLEANHRLEVPAGVTQTSLSVIMGDIGRCAEEDVQTQAPGQVAEGETIKQCSIMLVPEGTPVTGVSVHLQATSPPEGTWNLP